MQPRSWPSVRAVMIMIQQIECYDLVRHRGVMWTFPTEGETHWPQHRDILFSRLDVKFNKVFLMLICGKMARIMCCTPWCLHLWWDHRRGLAERWQTLLVPLLDILKFMYIKAELFWLGRCQNTFIWSVRHDGCHLKKTLREQSVSFTKEIYKLFSYLCAQKIKWMLNQS